MIPILFALNKSFSLLLLKSICFFLNLINPDEGLSIKDIRFNNVDLPEPEGPITE